MPDEEIVVELEGAPPSPAEVVVDEGKKEPEPKKVEAKEPTSETDKAVEDLRKERDRLKAEGAADKEARRRAESEVAEAKKTAARLEADVATSNTNAIESAIDAAKAEADTAERDYIAAAELGNHADMAKAQRRMAAAEARVLRFEEAKDDLVAQKKEPKPEARKEPEPRQDDPFETAIAGAGYKAREWLRAHPEFVTDPKKVHKATAAHSEALAAGYQTETDGYFEFCETYLGLREPKKEQPKQERGRNMPTAPVSRGDTPSGGNTSATVVRLSPGEQQAATDGTLVWNYDDPGGKFKKGQAIGLQEMGKRKLSLQKQGAYDRSYTAE